MQEDVRYLIDADDKATAKILKVNQSVEQQVKHVREVGGQAKASTEMVGALATSMGASGIGGFAGEIAMLTERVSAFSEVSKAGGAGALAFKAGLVGAAAVISVNVGKALGDVIFQTEEWTRSLERATAQAAALDAEIQSGIVRSFNQQLQAAQAAGEGIDDLLDRMENNADAVARRLESMRKQIQDVDVNGGFMQLFRFEGFTTEEFDVWWTAQTTDLKQSLEDKIAGEEALLKTYRDQAQQLREMTGKRAEEAKKAEEAAQAQRQAEQDALKRQEQSANFLTQLQRRYEAATMTADELLKIEIERSTIAGKDRDEALRIASELALVKQVADAEKQADEERLQRRKEIIATEQESIRNLQAQMNEIGKNLSPQTMPTLTAGTSTRLQTGAGSEFRKTAAVIEAERQTKLQTELVAIQDKIAKSLAEIAKQERIIKVIGD